ncbi:MAG: hypothetical protein Kow0096_07880 [Thiohalomonadaceae bacterium]
MTDVNDPVGALPSYRDDELAGLSETALLELLRRDCDRAPRNLIDACAARGDAMIRLLQETMSAPGSTECLEEGDWWFSYHAAMIAGLIPTVAAGNLLVDLMRRLDEHDDVNMQDWLAGWWPALFANKEAMHADALRAIAEDWERDVFLRVHAAETVHYLAQRQGAEQGEAALDWIAGLASDEQQEADSRLPFGFNLLNFPRERHRPVLERLVTLQQGYIKDFDGDDIAYAFAKDKDTPGWERFADPWQFYDPAQIEARQRRWAKESSYSMPPPDDTLLDWSEPYVRDEPKIGRNEPCPCGSGKKYKKCCLGKERG